jgi:hypothetical protein
MFGQRRQQGPRVSAVQRDCRGSDARRIRNLCAHRRAVAVRWPVRGRCRSGIGATGRRGPTGGGEDDGEIDELGVAAGPPVGESCRTVQVVAAATTTIAPMAAGSCHRRRDPGCCADGADVDSAALRVSAPQGRSCIGRLLLVHLLAAAKHARPSPSTDYANC